MNTLSSHYDLDFPVPPRPVRPEIAWPTWLCALCPAALLAGFVTLMLQVRLGLGHWPEPMREDYSTLAYRLHFAVTLWFFTASAGLAPLTWAALLLFRRTRGGRRFHARQAAVFALAWLAVISVWNLDPFRWVTWLLD